MVLAGNGPFHHLKHLTVPRGFLRQGMIRFCHQPLGKSYAGICLARVPHPSLLLLC